MQMARTAVWVVFVALLSTGVVVLLVPAIIAAQNDDPAAPQDVDTSDAIGTLDGLVARFHYILLLLPQDEAPPAAEQQQAVQVVELIGLYNPSDTPVDSAVIPLFAGASQLELWSGFEEATVQASAEAVRARISIAGGHTHSFGISYRLPAKDLPTTLSRAIAHPTERLIILLPRGSQVEPLADGIFAAGTDQFAGREVEAYAVEALSPVMEWLLGLRRVGSAGIEGLEGQVQVIDRKRTDGQGAWLLVMMALAAVVIGGGVSFFFRRAELMATAVTISDGTREGIINAAVQLEIARAEGRCPERVYRHRRRQLLLAWQQLHLQEQDQGL